MEEQMVMEQTGVLQGVPAESRNREETRQFTLQLGCMIAQWMVLLACAIAVGLCYLKSPDPQPQWVHIKLDLSSVSMEYADFKKEEGTMNILNQSIQIRCDGHYLFFLNGTIHLQPSSDSLMLSVKKSQDQQEKYLLQVLCSARKTVVQQAMVSQLQALDEISLKKNQSVRHEDLSLALFMLTPHSYCYPPKS